MNDKTREGAAGAATDTPAAPPPPHEPTPSEIAKLIGDFVSKIEKWHPNAQRRVLEGCATTLGIYKGKNDAPPAQRNQQGNRRS